MIAEGRHLARHDDTRLPAGFRAAAQAPRDSASGSARRLPFTSGEFLAFHLGNEEYCVEILKVLEIRSHQATRRIANAPAHVRGMVDLRGAIVPIVDLRLLFGMKAAVVTSATVVIVLNILGRTIGMVVDSVSDVVDLAGESVRQAPLSAAAVASSGIACIATSHGRTLAMLDVETLFRNPQVGLIH